MTQAYSNPARAEDDFALPDIEALTPRSKKPSTPRTDESADLAEQHDDHRDNI